MAGTHGANVAAGGLTGFPIGGIGSARVGAVGTGASASGSTSTRTLPMTPAQYVTAQFGNAEVPQGRPTIVSA